MNRNEQDTIDLLFREEFKPLCAYCLHKFMLDMDTAKDIVHTAFLHLAETNNRFETNSTAKAFLYKIVTNNCIDLLRHEAVKKKYQRINSIEKAEPAGTNSAEVKELMTAINTAVEEMPGQMQEIFRLSRYEGLKYTEIATRTGLSVKTVETQMSRALARLRQKLAPFIGLGCYFFVAHYF